MFSPRHPTEPSAASLLKSLIESVPALVSDRVHLLTLELRSALQALTGIVVFVVGAAVLLATAWFALWLGLAAALVQAGWAWGWITLLIVVLNGGAALFALLHAARLAPRLALPATMRRLTLPPPPAEGAAASASNTTTPASTAVERS